jgi:hypothetical protein
MNGSGNERLENGKSTHRPVIAGVLWSTRSISAGTHRRERGVSLKRQHVTVIALVGVLISLPTIGILFGIRQWLSSRPAWLLSARNSVDGVVVEVYKENESDPTYSTLLKGCSIARDIQRTARQDLPADIGTTAFFDDTIRPGRWEIVLAGVKLDIMERALILEDGTEILPRD